MTYRKSLFSALQFWIVLAIVAPSFALASASSVPKESVSNDLRVGITLPELQDAGPVFGDAMKQALPWTSSEPLNLDRFGNVVTLRPGQVADTVVYPTSSYPGGSYVLSYDGIGTFEVAQQSGVVVDRRPGRVVIRVAPRESYGIRLRLAATDPRNYPRNIRLVQMTGGFREQIFAASFLKTVGSFRVIRFAGWLRAQPSNGKTWGLRTQITSFTQAGAAGVALEYAIALANATGADPWFVLPANSTDDYIYNFSNTVARQLDPRLHPIFEYGNDVWRAGSPSNAFGLWSSGRSATASVDVAGSAARWYVARSERAFAIVTNAFRRNAARPIRVLNVPLASTPGNVAAATAIVSMARSFGGADALAVTIDDRADIDASLSPVGSFARAAAASHELAAENHLALFAYLRDTAEPHAAASPPVSGRALDVLELWHSLGGDLFVDAAPVLGTSSEAVAAREAAGAFERERPSVRALTEIMSSGTPGVTIRRSSFAVGTTLESSIAGKALLDESFSNSSTAAKAWLASGDACLTAGTAFTPLSSIRPCNETAPHDQSPYGGLQLTNAAPNRRGFAVFRNPLPTAGGLQVTFTMSSFGTATSGGDGVALFLSDAAQLMPYAPAGGDGDLGYGTPGAAGVAHAFVGIGLDERGAFGGVGRRSVSPGTLTVLGSAASKYRLVGSSSDASGFAAPLPGGLVSQRSATRPGRSSTIRAILLPSGLLTVAVDFHDGHGFTTYFRKNIIIGPQRALPASVYVGLTAGTSRAASRHQITDLVVSTLQPMTTFVPAQIQNLSAWFDASDSTSVAQTATGSVSAWNDKSGGGNGVVQPNPYLQPKYLSAGINGLGSVSMNGANALVGSNTSFAAHLMNEATVFIVSSEAATAQRSVLLYAGAYGADPHWSLHPSDSGEAIFDFNGQAAGRLEALDVPGTAVWTAAGSVSSRTAFLHKNGNLLASGAPSLPVTAGQYPFAIGQMWNGSSTGSYSFNGQIGEVVTYNRFLSSSESAQVEGYLACKWGLQTRLPANHPYRNVCPQGGTPTSTPTSAPTGNALPQPPELRSQNGRLTFNVVAQGDPVTGNPVLRYGTADVPPTLRLSPGDTLSVNLTNNLPQPPAGATYRNDTNLHYHGLHVSPNAPADDSIDLVAAPGQTLHYVIKIPTNHPPGLYWYHSHAHAESERQNLSGMSGALIVEGISQYAPSVANMPERVLVVRDAEPPGTALPFADPAQLNAMQWAMQRTGRSSSMKMDMESGEVRGESTEQTRNPYVFSNPLFRHVVAPLTASTHCQGPETASKVWTVNGASNPSIGIRPGEQQFWRLVNAGSDTYLDVALDNAMMKIVALDGVPLIEGVNTPATLTVSHYVVPPASRIEFIVIGPPASKPAYLRTNCFDAGSSGVAMPAAVLASINPASSPSDLVTRRQRPAALARPFRFHSAAFVKAHAIAATQTIYYSDQLTINGQSYDPAAPPLLYAQSGTVQEWTIVNTDTQVHTFHIHQIHFVLEAINGISQAQQFMMDNVNVPPATTSGPGTVKVLLDFTDPLIVGTFLLHCHILSHEDAGMMAKIRVGPAPPLTLNPAQITFATPTSASQNVTIGGGKAPFSVSGSGCSNVSSAVISGNAVSITPRSAGSCLLGIADSSGLTGAISVTVVGAASPVSLKPTSVSFTSPTAPGQHVVITGGKLPYSATGCANIAGLSISGAALTVSPLAAGTCTVTVSDANNATASLAVAVNAAPPSTGSGLDNLTFHQNSDRTGWYQKESVLSPATVNAANFGRITTLADPSGKNIGKIHAQPLYVTAERTVDGGTHNLVIVATGTDQVYAFDDRTYKVVWERSFTNVAAGVTQQSWQDTGCYGPSPDVGIVGTPVVDRGLDRLYVVVATKETGTFHLRLHAISVSSGLEATSNGKQVGPTDITATVALASGGTASVDPKYNLQRPGLLEANGNIYVGLGSKCDFHISSLHGWMLAYNATTLLQTGNALAVTDRDDGNTQFLGSVWMSGFGPAADAQGNVYFATGNGAYDGTSNFAMSVIEAPGNLDMSKAQHFTPYLEAADSASDADLGAGGVMLLPDQPGSVPQLAVAGGKCGAGTKNGGTNGCMKYLLNRSNLGGQKPGDAGAAWQGNTAGYIWGGPAYFEDTTGSYVVYGGGVSYAPLSTYLIGSAPVSLKIATSQGSLSCLECRLGGSQPVVSSNGTQAGSAIVWALQTPGQKGGSITLYAFNASKMSQILFSGLAGAWTIASGAPSIGSALVSPTVANGRVYVPVDNGVAVFGVGG